MYITKQIKSRKRYYIMIFRFKGNFLGEKQEGIKIGGGIVIVASFCRLLRIL
jgi:hypothetical protein